jgi:pimeloyl-ACP methyl ester carboxylesterase
MPVELWSRLGEIAPPVRIIVGEHGFPFVLATAPRLQKRLRHGSLVVEPGASHFWPLEQPSRIAQEVAALLKNAPAKL